jgi:hypothetical protein
MPTLIPKPCLSFAFIALIALALSACTTSRPSKFILNVKPGVTSLEEALKARTEYAGEAVLQLESGSYTFTHSLTIPPATELLGKGGSTVLHAIPASPDQPCGLVAGSNTHLADFRLVYNHYQTRQQTSATAMIYICDAQNVSIYNVEVTGSASVGFMIDASSSIDIYRCIVSNTLADGIHITHGSSHINVRDCHVFDTGDDAIATVSYRSKASQCHDIFLTGNHVENAAGRALSCIGSRNVVIARNHANNAYGGIYVAYESSYDTYAPSNVSITHNTLSRCGKRDGMHSLHIGSARNVQIKHNRFIGCRPAYIANTGAGSNQAIIFTYNRFEQTLKNGHSPVEFFDTSEVEIGENQFSPYAREPFYFADDVGEMSEITATTPFRSLRLKQKNRTK